MKCPNACKLSIIFVCAVTSACQATLAADESDRNSKSEWIEESTENNWQPSKQPTSSSESNVLGELLLQEKNKKIAFEHCVRSARAADEKHDWKAAASFYERAITLSNFKTASPGLVLNCQLRLNELSRLTGDPNQAFRASLQLMSHLQNSPLDNFQISKYITDNNYQALLLKAEKLRLKGQIHEAEMFLKYLASCQKDPQIDKIATTLIQYRLLRIHLEQSNLEQALIDFDGVSGNDRNVKDDSIIIAVRLSAQACIANANSNFAESNRLNRNCIEILKTAKRDHRYDLFLVLQDQAKTFEKQKDLNNAALYFSKALEAAAKPTPLSDLYQNPVRLQLAECYKKLGRVDRARELIQATESERTLR